MTNMTDYTDASDLFFVWLSVARLPELLSASYRNRVRKLSPRNQNQGVKHLPGSHILRAGFLPSGRPRSP